MTFYEQRTLTSVVDQGFFDDIKEQVAHKSRVMVVEEETAVGLMKLRSNASTSQVELAPLRRTTIGYPVFSA